MEESALTPGQVVSGYRIVRELGRGGMGIVYEAEEVASGRRVALKVLNTDLRTSEEARARFEREARLAASISHPNCVFVFGFIEIDGSLAISMELVGGETLEDRLRRARTDAKDAIPIVTAVRWILQILDGLEAAHAAGVLHRDIKPSNCFLTDDGIVKLGDFGLSRVLVTDLQLTQQGAFIGSPLFASPEQIKGNELDFRSDIYSAGATLYALLTNRTPFDGSGFGEVLARILTDPPKSLRGARPDIPRGLEKIVLKALAKDPRQRFASIAAFRRALEMFSEPAGAVASIGGRVAAMLIDFVVTSAAYFGMTEPLLISAGWTRSFVMQKNILTLQETAVSLSATFLVVLIYFGFMEGLLGCSLGKWVIGLRVVATKTNRPTLGGAFVRALIWNGSASLTMFLSVAAFGIGLGQQGNALLTWGLHLLLCSTMRPSTGMRGIHEYGSGTRVVQQRSLFNIINILQKPLEEELRPVEPWNRENATYRVLGEVVATPAGPILAAEDLLLRRKIWIHYKTNATGAAGPRSESGRSKAEVRWLGRGSHGGRDYDIYESPGGAGVETYIKNGRAIPWAQSYQILLALAADLARAPRPLSLSQLWIDSAGRLRILEIPAGNGPHEPRGPVEIIQQLSRELLFRKTSESQQLPRDVPVHAEALVRRLLSFDSTWRGPDEILQILQSFEHRSPLLSRGIRVVQAALSGVGMVVPTAFMIVIFVLMNPIFEVLTFSAQWQTTNAAIEKNAKIEDQQKIDALQTARRMMIAKRTAELSWRLMSAPILAADSKKSINIDFINNCAKEYSNTDGPEFVAAEQTLRAFVDAPAETQPSLALRYKNLAGREPPPRFTIASIVFGATAFITIVLSILFRGGITLRICGIALRDARGRLAPRWRCAIRALVVVAVPALFIYIAGILENAYPFWLAPGLVIFAGIVYFGCGLYALTRANRGVQDWIAGTWPVAR
ncbi:MAG: protein kinase domain-containing protein [Planctomycetota bacterium]